MVSFSDSSKNLSQNFALKNIYWREHASGNKMKKAYLTLKTDQQGSGQYLTSYWFW
jgi:hypothetical protein